MAIRWLATALLAALWGAPALAGETATYLRFAHDGGASYGLLEDDGRIAELAGPPYRAVVRTGRVFERDAVRLLVPSEPSKVLAVGQNYASHMSRAGDPALFAKLPSSLLADGEAIVMPAEARNLHYEGELVVVIGRRARDVPEAEAGAYVFAVAAGNDLSERTWQAQDLQWLRAKASDGFGPVGPAMVAGLDHDDLVVETRVNGEVRQHESTAGMTHSVARIVSFASRYFTLEPGDLIFTGTPGRTAALKPGDVVEVEVEGVGVLRNPVRAKP